LNTHETSPINYQTELIFYRYKLDMRLFQVFLLLSYGSLFVGASRAFNTTYTSEHTKQASKPDFDSLQDEYHTFTSMVQTLSFSDAFISSISMILVSEMGDETFIIAAIMAMRHPRITVLGGAFSALFVMTILSTALGLVVPKLITRRTTARLAGVLYFCFGLRLMYIAWRSDPGETAAAEFEEVEEKLGCQGQPKNRFRRVFARFCTPIFLEAFVLTFLAEWGDRSQITTIALAAHKNPIGVTAGASIGHFFCTGLAVVGGRLLATKISQRTVAISGGMLFLIFSAHSFYSALS